MPTIWNNDEENNVIYEVEEYYHRVRKGAHLKDKLRRNRIIQCMDCKFIRIDEPLYVKEGIIEEMVS